MTTNKLLLIKDASEDMGEQGVKDNLRVKSQRLGCRRQALQEDSFTKRDYHMQRPCSKGKLTYQGVPERKRVDCLICNR